MMGLGVRQPGKPFAGSAVVPALATIQCGGCGAWHAVQACPWCGRPHVARSAPVADSDGVFRITARYGHALPVRLGLTAGEVVDAFDALSVIAGGTGKPTKR